MKIALALLGGCAATMASAQITSVADPSAFRPDRPAPATPSKQNPASEPAPSAKDDPTSNSRTHEAAAPTGIDQTPLSPAALNLICGGGGTANKPSVASIYGSSNASGMVGSTPINMYGNSSGTIVTQRQQGFADQVDVRLFSGDDRIRMPRTMLPPIHGGSDGWFKLKNVQATDRAITASASINFINNPKVHIDRLTGTISINGKAGSYTGQCEAIDANAQRRF